MKRLGITKSDFARVMGVSAPRVSQWIRDGILTRRSILADGSLDEFQAMRDVRGNRDPCKREDFELRVAEENKVREKFLVDPRIKFDFKKEEVRKNEKESFK